MPVRLSTTKRAAVLAAALLLTGCGGGGGKAGNAAGIEFRPIGGDVFAVTIAPDADVPKTEAAFRKHCETRQACTIYGWTDATAAARSEPLTDPQTRHSRCATPATQPARTIWSGTASASARPRRPV